MKKILRNHFCLAILLILSLIFFTGCPASIETSNVPSNIQTEGDFRLNISVDTTNIKLGENIEVSIEFKNLSGKDVNNIARTFHLIYLQVPIFYENHPALVAIQDSFFKDEIRTDKKTIGSQLPRGKHELFAVAFFTTEGQAHYIYSNTIFLSVH